MPAWQTVEKISLAFASIGILLAFIGIAVGIAAACLKYAQTARGAFGVIIIAEHYGDPGAEYRIETFVAGGGGGDENSSKPVQ